MRASDQIITLGILQGASGPSDGPQVAAYNQATYLAIQAPSRFYPLNDADAATVTFTPNGGSPVMSVFQPGSGLLPGGYPLVNNAAQTSVFLSRTGMPRPSAADGVAIQAGANPFNLIVTTMPWGTAGDDGDDTPFDHIWGCRDSTAVSSGYGIGTYWTGTKRVAAFLMQGVTAGNFILAIGSTALQRDKAYNLAMRFGGSKLAANVQLYTETGGVTTIETMTVLSDTMGADTAGTPFSWSLAGIGGSRTVLTTQSSNGAIWGATTYTGAMTEARMLQLLAARPARIQRVRNESVTPEHVLWDTDATDDFDDGSTGEHLIGAHKRGSGVLIDVNVSSSNVSSAPAINAMLKSRGVSVPLSCYKGNDRISSGVWTPAIVTQFGLTKTRANFPDPVASMTAALSAQPSASVTYLETGPMSDLAALIAAQNTLFAQKVKRIVLMGTRNSGAVEYNIQQDITSARYVIANSPVPIFVAPFELASGVGFAVPGNPKYHPARAGFDAAYGAGAFRGSAFDVIASHYALFPASPLYGQDFTNATLTINLDGTTSWAATTGTHNRLTLSSATGLIAVAEPIIGSAAMDLLPAWSE